MQCFIIERGIWKHANHVYGTLRQTCGTTDIDKSAFETTHVDEPCHVGGGADCGPAV